MEAVLERALEDKNPIVRLDAVRLLGTMTDPDVQKRAASALGRALKDPDENTRFEAVKALSNFSADIAGPYLMKAMGDDSVRIRIQVVQVLRQLYQSQANPLQGIDQLGN